MFLVKDWEMFYTDSKNNEDLVDQVSIDKGNKRYVLDIDADILVTDGYDEEMNDMDSTYVSRFIFDIIVKGLEENNFRKLKWEDDEF